MVQVKDAQKAARDADLDLVEVAPTAQPPVCRIMDFHKYVYDQTKKTKEQKKKQHQHQLKEIQIKPKIGEHDLQTKVGHLRRFLLHGDKAKVTLIFRGREMSHPELGRIVLDRVAEELKDVAQIEKPPSSEGRLMVMYLAPKSTGIRGSESSEDGKKDSHAEAEDS